MRTDLTLSVTLGLTLGLALIAGPALAQAVGHGQHHGGHQGHASHQGHDVPADHTRHQAPPAERRSPKDHGGHGGHGGHQGHGAPSSASRASPRGADVEHAADLYFDPQRMARARAQLRAENGDIRLGAVFIERLEARIDDGEAGLAFEAQAWRGGDINRVWLKTEGEAEPGGPVEDVSAQLLYSRAVRPFWDVQAGVEHAWRRHGPDISHLVLGVQGLAPYWWEVDAALRLSEDGDLTAKAEGEYDQRLTQRLILQPRLEVALAADDIDALELGAGPTSWSAGLRLRYELAREFAPYVGVEWEGALGETAQRRRAAGDPTGEARLVLGLRAWF